MAGSCKNNVFHGLIVTNAAILTHTRRWSSPARLDTGYVMLRLRLAVLVQVRLSRAEGPLPAPASNHGALFKLLPHRAQRWF